MDWTNLLGLFLIACIGCMGLILHLFRGSKSLRLFSFATRAFFLTGAIAFGLLLNTVGGRLGY